MRKTRRKTDRKWRARRGARFNNTEAQEIGERLEALAEGCGIPYIQLTVDQILEDALDNRSPLSKHIEWDAEKALNQHRRSQIRHMVSHLDVVGQDEEGNEVRYKAFFSYEVESLEETAIPQRAYGDMEAVRSSKAIQESLVADFEKQVRYWVRMVKMAGLDAKFKEIIQAVDRYERRMTK